MYILYSKKYGGYVAGIITGKTAIAKFVEGEHPLCEHYVLTTNDIDEAMAIYTIEEADKLSKHWNIDGKIVVNN